MSTISHKNVMYESVELESLSQQDLRYIYKEMSSVMEHLNNCLNNVQDNNMKRSIRSIMKRCIKCYNNKIKHTHYNDHKNSEKPGPAKPKTVVQPDAQMPMV